MLLWKYETNSDDDVTTVKVTKMAEGYSHTKSLGSLAFSTLQTPPFLVSVSHDLTLKTWRLVQKEDDVITLSVRKTLRAHEKDINAVCVSPNDSIVATGSQDKNVKLWNSNDLTFIGSCQGHSKAVWSVAFSPVDQVGFERNIKPSKYLNIFSINAVFCSA